MLWLMWAPGAGLSMQRASRLIGVVDGLLWSGMVMNCDGLCTGWLRRRRLANVLL